MSTYITTDDFTRHDIALTLDIPVREPKQIPRCAIHSAKRAEILTPDERIPLCRECAHAYWDRDELGRRDWLVRMGAL